MLRGLGAPIELSAAHLSDIEHLATGLDQGTRDWVASTPGVRRLLRTLKQSGHHPRDILPALAKVVGRKSVKKRSPARAR
jgi:hypothetical protein